MQRSHFIDGAGGGGTGLRTKEGQALAWGPTVDFCSACTLNTAKFAPHPCPGSRVGSGEGRWPKGDTASHPQGSAGLTGLLGLPLSPLGPQLSKSRP